MKAILSILFYRKHIYPAFILRLSEKIFAARDTIGPTSPPARPARTAPLHRASHSYLRYDGATGHTRQRTHGPPPPRPTQLPAIRRRHRPHAHAPRTPTSSAPASPMLTSSRTRTHHARPLLHHAAHSYLRYDGDTGHTRQRTHGSPPPRLAQLPAIRRCHRPHVSAHGVGRTVTCARLQVAGYLGHLCRAAGPSVRSPDCGRECGCTARSRSVPCCAGARGGSAMW
jgi:hypothetical protein